ncbi:nucleotide sugar dehydrogenase [bacterium]|nr:nucleotide sugar dehydrogenase [bacterium]
MKDNQETIVAVVGLGYVGLPLAVAFGKLGRVIGFDLSEEKVASYKKCVDPADEVTESEFRDASSLEFTADSKKLSEANVFIVAVPTPVDEAYKPDFAPLVSASRLIGQNMRQGSLVIYESTVYPGATEEVCIPVLEKESGMKWQKDFRVGYSPERINPGDKEHVLSNTIKIVSGDRPETLDEVAQLYNRVVKAGVFKASSIQAAEAAKVIENTQRDLNIALMNELAIIFNRMNIDTMEVLKAAGTKWNFLPFRPGLVGGHCIGVDPYYLTYKAEVIGYHPQVILAGRRINDGMAKFVAESTVKELIQSGSGVKGAKVNVLGLSFKENCPDLRNSKVVDMIRELESFGLKVAVNDPLVSPQEALREYELSLTAWDNLSKAEVLVLAVAHKEYLKFSLEELTRQLLPNGCIIDVKSQLDADKLRKMGYRVWRL